MSSSKGKKRYRVDNDIKNEPLILTLLITKDDIDNFNDCSKKINLDNIDIKKQKTDRNMLYYDNYDNDHETIFDNNDDSKNNQVSKNNNNYTFISNNLKGGLNSLIPSRNIYKNTNFYKIHELINLYSNHSQINKQDNQYKHIKCWWCCNNFNSFPVSIPLHFNEHIKQFKVYGYFCSFNCAKAYLNSANNKYYNKNNSQYLLNFMYSKLTNDKSVYKINNFIKCKG